MANIKKIFNTKKTIIALLLFFQLFFFAKPVSASWYHQSFFEWYSRAFDYTNPTEIFGERYAAAQTQWVFFSIIGHTLTAITLGKSEPWICLFSGDVVPCLEGVRNVMQDMFNNVSGLFSYSQTPDISNVSNNSYNSKEKGKFSLYYFFYNNELSGTGYLLRKISQISPVSAANAQGFGYKTGGSAVKKLWKTTRDMAYSLMIFVTIILSFMLMFRVKISPQATITAQLILVKITTAIILITFSYAIAGFLIDLMYVAIGIISFTIKETGMVYDDYSAMELFNDLAHDRIVLILNLQYIVVFLFGTIATIFSSSLLGGIILLIFLVIVLIASLFNIVKTTWVLIKTYINIVLSIASAPLQILIGTLSPGYSFFGWIKKLVANLAVYPTVSIMYFMAFFFAVQAIGDSDIGTILAGASPFQIKSGFLETGDAWNPPLTFGAIKGGRFLWMLASFGIFMAIPKAADMVKAQIEKVKPFEHEKAIGESVAPARGVGKGGLQWVATANEIVYKRIPEGGEIPKSISTQKKFFDAMRRVGWVK